MRSIGGSPGEAEAVSRLKTEDDGFRVLIEDSPKFLYEGFRSVRIVSPSSTAVARAVAVANQAALDQGACV